MNAEIKTIKGSERVVVTSLDIAETFGKEHKQVLRDIREIKCSAEFGRHNFTPTSYIDQWNRKQPMYYVTRDGFTLLAMGYTGEKALKFKEGYIKQFSEMEKALTDKNRERIKALTCRMALTEALQQSTENLHGFAYSLYTDLVYKAVFGKNARQLRETLKLDKKESLREHFSEEELRAVQSKEFLVSGLIGCGMSYRQIRDFLNTVSLQETGLQVKE